jgi:myosin heavy subunit
MRAVGLDPQTQVQCMAIVAATLHIGNITFVENPGDGYASIADEECKFCIKLYFNFTIIV